MSGLSMRNSKQVLGVLAFLVALPAWASDMCPLAMFLLLPPVYLLVIVSCLVGWLVRSPTAAMVWGVLLLSFAVLAVAAIGGLFQGSFHGSELAHPEMIWSSVLTAAVLLASHVWVFRRLILASRRPQGTSERSQSV